MEKKPSLSLAPPRLEPPRLLRMDRAVPAPRLKPPQLRVRPRRWALPQSDGGRLPKVTGEPLGRIDGPDPYVGYRRRLTADGGIIMTYSTVDRNFWRSLLQYLLWFCATSMTAVFLLQWSPATPVPPGCHPFGPCAQPMSVGLYLINSVVFVAHATFYGYLLFRDPVVQRTVAVYSDRLVLDGNDVFWARKFEDMPRFRFTEKDSWELVATYGTREVKLLETQAFDGHDCAPTVFQKHFQAAIQRLWFPPSTGRAVDTR